MPETDYTVASNDQLLGGNLRKKCACHDRAEATRGLLHPIYDAASPHSPSESVETISTDLLDLYNHSSQPSTEDSANTEELITSFPVPPRLTIRRATTPDIWLDTEVSEPSHSNDTVEDGGRRASPIEIFFSPLHISGSRCELSSPLNSPLTTPTQESFDAVVRRKRSVSSERSENKIALSAEDLTRLVRALVDSDMIQERLSSRRLRRSRMEPLSDLEGHREMISSPRELQIQYESTFRNRFSDIKAPKAKFCGIRLIDTNVEGSPICMMSKQNDSETDEARIGELSHVESPGTSSVECSLHTSSGAKDRSCSVMLQIANRVLQRTSGKQKYLLITTVDVTEGFTKAALFELLKASTLPLFDQTDQISTAMQYIANLRSDTCTMQTLTLLSGLSRIRDQFIDFYIARATETHENGVPKNLVVPLVSEGLYSMLSEKDGEDLRHLIVGMLGRYSAAGEAFTSTIEWDGEERRVRCVPLVGEGDTGLSWVCFARDGFDIGDW